MSTVTVLQAFPDGPKGRAPEVRNAYRFLRGAHRSADGVLVAAAALADQRRRLNTDTRGRPSETEVDLHRSAIVLTSSGVDAAMSRLLWDVGLVLVRVPDTSARAAHEAYIKEQLASKNGASADLRQAILAADPAVELIRHYLHVKARASFQGSGDLKSRVRSTLGIAKRRLPDATLASLDPFFTARNQIVHEMDYEQPRNSDTRARRHRSLDETKQLCDNAFAVCADLVHAAAESIGALRSWKLGGVEAGVARLSIEWRMRERGHRQ